MSNLTDNPVTGGAPAPSDATSPKDALLSLVDAYEDASSAVLRQTDVVTTALVAQATANAQVTAAQAAMSDANKTKESALASLKGYINSLDADGNPPAPTPATGTGTGGTTVGGTADQAGTAPAV